MLFKISPLRPGVFHDDDVHNLAPLFVERLQTVVVGAVVQSADKQLTRLLSILALPEATVVMPANRRKVLM